MAVVWWQHWHAKGQFWRSEPEISDARKEYLNLCRLIEPNLIWGFFPFQSVRLARADVEWLLETHENGLGPIDWDDKDQHSRRGLDLRGADLSEANLRNLPLS